MVDWSWELLNVAECHVLARLSVFAGGFDLAAAEAVTAGEDVPLDEVVGHLGALVDKNSYSSTTRVPDPSAIGYWKLSGSTRRGGLKA